MQQRKEFYNPAHHDAIPALMVKQPYAHRLLEIGSVGRSEIPDKDGLRDHFYAEKRIEVRSKNTKFRGDVLICASKKPDDIGLPAGCTIGYVELYDVKRVEDFTEEDWFATCIPAERRKDIKTGFGWMMRNPRRVIELPVSGQLGIFTLYFTKDTIIEYPRNMEYDPQNITKKMERASADVRNLMQPIRGTIGLYEFDEDGERYYVSAPTEAEAVSCMVIEGLAINEEECRDVFAIRELTPVEINAMQVCPLDENEEVPMDENDQPKTVSVREFMPAKGAHLVCGTHRDM